MLVGCDIVNNVLRLSYYNQEGKLEIVSMDIPNSEMYNWYESQNVTGYYSYLDKNVAPVSSFNLTRFRLEEIIQKYCIGEVRDKVFSHNTPIISYIDIENDTPDVGNDFTYSENADYPINTISIVRENNIIILTTLQQIDSIEQKKLTDEVNEYFKKYKANFTLFYRSFSDEGFMLNFFCNALLPKLGFITGWNSIQYDWQYITNRCVKKGVNIYANLPTQNTITQYKIPVHVGMVDCLEAFKYFDVLKIENYKLKTVASKVLGITKLENSEKNFHQFINSDTHRFILYNIVDSCLVKYIDEELNIMNLVFSMCNLSEIEVSRILSNVYLADLLHCKKHIKRNKHLPIVNQKNGFKDESYSGSYIKEPQKGLVNTVVQYDMRSMFPNIGREFNLSEETYLGTDESLLVGKKYVKTAIGTCFDISKESVTKEIFGEYYNKRREIQNELSELKKQLIK